MKVLSGAHAPDSGQIEVFGKRFTHMTAELSYRLGINIIYQESLLMPWMNVYENVYMGQELSRGGFVNFNKEKEKTRKSTVGIQILGNQHRVTTEKYRVQLLQLDAVSERVEPVTVKVAIYDDELLVSDIKTVSFDSSSNNLAERQKDIILTLQNRAYDHQKNYRLVVRDVNTNIEICSVDIRINRSFISDF